MGGFIEVWAATVGSLLALLLPFLGYLCLKRFIEDRLQARTLPPRKGD
jgi:hypothetical protein